MANKTSNLFLRNDTIFGVCEGLGQDVGINPNFLRVPLGVAIIFAPLWVIGIYAGLGLLVLASRLLFPDRAANVAAVTSEPAPVAPAYAVEAQDTRELAEAA
jgi:phage shock protein PspC (stress-responsive transcriptional regulator)